MPDSVVQVVFAIIHLHFHNEVFPTAQQVFWLFTQKSVLGKRGGTDIVHLAALMGVVGRCGVVMIQGLQAPKRPCKLQRPRGPRRAGQTASTHSRVRAWIPQGKASNGIDIYWQATDAGKSAFRDDGACGERGRIRGASVGSVAVVASVACVASVAVVASVPWSAWGSRDARAHGTHGKPTDSFASPS